MDWVKYIQAHGLALFKSEVAKSSSSLSCVVCFYVGTHRQKKEKKKKHCKHKHKGNQKSKRSEKSSSSESTDSSDSQSEEGPTDLSPRELLRRLKRRLPLRRQELNSASACPNTRSPPGWKFIDHSVNTLYRLYLYVNSCCEKIFILNLDISKPALEVCCNWFLFLTSVSVRGRNSDCTV